MVDNTTVVIANYLHPHFTKECVESVRKYYPTIPIVVVDDCSYLDENITFNDDGPTYFKILSYHMGHGIALDYGVKEAKTKYVITMDHDIALIKEGTFEYLFSFMKDEYTFAVGKHKNNQSDFPFVAPQLALWRADLIRQYHLSFSEVTVTNNQDKVYHFAVAQQMCARMERVYGYDLVGQANALGYFKSLGYAKYPANQHDYKIRRTT